MFMFLRLDFFIFMYAIVICLVISTSLFIFCMRCASKTKEGREEAGHPFSRY